MAIFPENRDYSMRWKFPLRATTTCWNCRAQFEIVFLDRDSERHPCSHCGTIHLFALPSAAESAPRAEPPRRRSRKKRRLPSA